jgi:hypothetical protein
MNPLDVSVSRLKMRGLPFIPKPDGRQRPSASSSRLDEATRLRVIPRWLPVSGSDVCAPKGSAGARHRGRDLAERRLPRVSVNHGMKPLDVSDSRLKTYLSPTPPDTGRGRDDLETRDLSVENPGCQSTLKRGVKPKREEPALRLNSRYQPEAVQSVSHDSLFRYPRPDLDRITPPRPLRRPARAAPRFLPVRRRRA